MAHIFYLARGVPEIAAATRLSLISVHAILKGHVLYLRILC